MDRIVALVLDPGVDRLDQPGLVRPLSLAQFLREVIGDTATLQFVSIRAGRRRLESEVDANRFGAGAGFFFDFGRRIEVPATSANDKGAGACLCLL